MSMIPKLLHQTAKTSVVPEKWKPLQERLLQHHRGWGYRLWNDTDNEALLTERRPDLLPTYRSMPRPIMRADLIRYVYMEQFGGLYLDTDYEFVKPFDLLQHAVVLPRESEDSSPIYLGNCILASVPGHSFWTAALADLRDHPPGDRTDLNEHDVLKLTGPGFLSRIYHESFEGDSSIFVPPKNWFNPAIPREDRAYRALVHEGTAYGIHYCFGSWRALSVRDRAVQKLRKWGLLP